MISRKSVFIVSIACLFFGLNACKSGGNSNQSQVATVDNSNTALDWEGTYTGVVPCADCAGIETKISLKGNNTYRISWKYMGKDDAASVKEGTFKWNSSGNMITLENLNRNNFPTMYKVCENYLLQLDLKGKVISGKTADKYRLNKN